MAARRKDLDEAEARVEQLKRSLVEVKKAVRDTIELLEKGKG
jgi:hypothetical protein